MNEKSPKKDVRIEEGSLEQTSESWVKPVEGLSTSDERILSWTNDFTNPNDHPFWYTYQVHALASRVSRSIQQHVMLDLREGAGLEAASLSSIIDLLEDPTRIAEKSVISTSVINPEHSHLWGDVGLIISCPPQNVLGIYPEDAGTPWFKLAKDVRRDGLSCTVDELLAATTNTFHNEVVIEGTTAGSSIELIGILIVVGKDGKPMDEYSSEIMVRHANRLKLPIVKVLDRSPRTVDTTYRGILIDIKTIFQGADRDRSNKV